MKYKNKKGFSIVLALGMMLLMTFTGLYVMEYMIPFSRNIKGVENASKAFYQAYSGIEHALYELDESDPSIEASRSISSDPKDYEYAITALGNTIPNLGAGNSEYDENWNTLTTISSVGFQVSNGVSSINLNLRVPDYDGNGSPDSLISGTDIFILQLSSSDDSLSSKDLIDIPFSGNIFSEVGLRQGEATTASGETFGSFYASECTGTPCVLKLGIANPLINSQNTALPYLEYQFTTTGTAQIPLSHAYIDVSGLSYGFGKNLKLAQPQRSTNSAFDFAIFQ